MHLPRIIWKNVSGEKAAADVATRETRRERNGEVEEALSCYRVAMMPDRRRCHPRPERGERTKRWSRSRGGRVEEERTVGGESNLKRDHRLLAISSRRDTWCLWCSCSCYFLSRPVKATRDHQQAPRDSLSAKKSPVFISPFRVCPERERERDGD